jgi:hypothetical protein
VQTAKPCSNVGGAVPYSTRPKVVLGFISRPLQLPRLIAVRPTRHRQVFSFLIMVLALLPNALKSFPAPHRKCFVFLEKIQAFSSYQGRIDEVHIIGRVVWFARRL